MRKCSGVLLTLTLAALLLLLSPLPSPSPPPATATAGPVAHLLSSLPGLSDLYPPPANSTAHLSWALLRPLLCRSDALPGTSAGVLEAADAWRNLTLALTVSAGEDGPRGRGASCPESVEGDLREGSARIPCGLAEGAAVTVVGVPGEDAARFWVEMMGAGGEVVVRINVSSGAAGMVVEQNSWTPEAGWGEWERCPPVGDVGSSNSSSEPSAVDGLVRCNEKAGASIIQESNNTVINVTGNLPEDGKRPKGRAHLSGSFSTLTSCGPV